MPIVISLTSFPVRLPYLHHTLYSIYTQTYTCFTIALFLSLSEIPDRKLPYILRVFIALGLLKVHFVEENLRAYKKLIYTPNLYPNHLIITIDDDQIYDPNLVSLLVAAHLRHPKCICVNAYYVEELIDNVGINIDAAAYKNTLQAESPHLAIMGLGVSGILYPPNSLHNELYNTQALLDLCPYADDLWFFVASVLQNTKKILIANALGHSKQTSIAEFESPNLWEINCVQNRNYDQMQALLKAYPQVRQKLIESLTNSV